MGVSLSQTVLARREQFHQERLSENVGSWNPFYYDTLNQIEAYFRTHTFIGSSSGTSVAYVGQMVHSQAAILAYICARGSGRHHELVATLGDSRSASVSV
jgi:MFS transporter, DHA2 family, multidrug resistance protein